MPGTSSRPTAIAVLGYGGLLPFLGGAIGIWLPVSWAPVAAFGFMGYSAAILSFLGGLQWGIALQPETGRLRERLIVGVLPVLVAAISLPIGVRWGAPILLLGFVLLLVWECLRNRTSMPAWYLPMRIRLTVIVAACHVAVLGFFAN